MMKIKSFVEANPPGVYAYASVNTARKMLQKHPYLLVYDENDQYCGVLTKQDIISCHHLLVADCVTSKVHVQEDDSLLETLNYMITENQEALPVKKSNQSFAGVISLNKLTEYLLKYAIHLENRLRVEKH